MTIPSSPSSSMSEHLTLSELSRKATVDKTDLSKYSIKTWISSVKRLYEQGDFEYKRHCIDKAYVHYMKGCSIMVEVIAKHQHFKEAKKDPVYKQLKARTSDDILVLLEKLSMELQQRDVENQDILQQMNKYPSVDDLEASSDTSDNLLDGLPSVPTHSPSRPMQPTNNSPPSNPPPPPKPANQTYMRMPEPPSQPTVRSTDIILPTPSNFNFPPVLLVDPYQLAGWIVKKNGVEAPPHILLLDVRPRDVFMEGFIKHKWIAQIEPLVLKQDVPSRKIEESMVMNPEAEQQIFAGRHHFDLVVFYDQNSLNLAEGQYRALGYLRQAIYEQEFQKVLQRAPMMLAGGFDAWKAVIGEKGVFKYKEPTVESRNQPRPHWLQGVMGTGSDQSINLTPVKVHHTLYDYFSYTGSSPAANKESMSRYTHRVETPPLRGFFSNTLSQPYSHPTTSMPMPIPQPLRTPDIDTFTTKYPDIKPNTSQAPLLSRKKTFIDNPFHGFTTTTNKQFDVPPLPPKTNIVTPSAPPVDTTSDVDVAPKLPPKPYAASPPLLNAYRTAPVSDNNFSQVGNVMIGTTGLKNLGNTCFMNSIIQCLSGTIPFARYFISGIFKQHINKDNFLGTGGALAEAFSTLLRTMWSENYNFISPTVFREALIKFAPQFKGSEQHDSQEFLNFLLDGLHEDCNLIVKRPAPTPESAEEEARFEMLPDWQASAIAWEKYLERNSSVVVSLFQGQYRSRLTCLTCRATSTTYNSFMSLSLPIPAKRKGPASVSLYQCLDYFVKEEVLDMDDAWHCPKCKELRKATKSLTLSKLPDVLLIHLKRFSFDGPFKDKLETIVDSPMTGLDLSRYVPRTMFAPDQPPETSSFCYDLYAVSNHFGSLTGGHYTACVRNGYRNEWHNFDDSRFSVCDQSKVLSRAAYNLFYVRSSVK